MANWYRPDPIWKTVGKVTDRDHYVRDWVIRGRWHSSVPEEVQSTWPHVEYLMAHAWYHWPMYDDALQRGLGVFEMAVKLRCKQLEIALEKHVKKGRVLHKNLSRLIGDVLEKEPEKEQLKLMLDVFRKTRNHYAHPSMHFIAGGIGRPRMVDIVNVLNLLFLSEAQLRAPKEFYKEVKSAFQPFQAGCFVLHHSRQRILVEGAQLLGAFSIEPNPFYLFSFRLVLVDTEQVLAQPTAVNPPVFGLRQLESSENGFSGIDLEDGERISLTATQKPEDLEAYRRHREAVAAAEEKNRQEYDSMMNRLARESCQRLMYRFRWDGGG